jgi:uncharacterized protein YjiS (DUF1127 family)
MTRLESSSRSDARAGFGTLFSTAAALTSPVQGQLDRPFYGDVPPLALRGGMGRARDLLLLWQDRMRQRHQLAQLSDEMLRDIGISRADALAEAEKPFWQA